MIQNKHQNQLTHTPKNKYKWYTEHKLLQRPSKFPDLNPIENECGELKKRCTNMELRIWRIWNDYIWRIGSSVLSLVALFTEVMWAFTVLHGSRDDYCMNSVQLCLPRYPRLSPYIVSLCLQSCADPLSYVMWVSSLTVLQSSACLPACLLVFPLRGRFCCSFV